jgi:hypothetical protein
VIGAEREIGGVAAEDQDGFGLARGIQTHHGEARLPGTEDRCSRISAKARRRGIYIAANMMEVHADFPGRFFNTSFLVSPQGEIPIKHWKNNNNAWVFPNAAPAASTAPLATAEAARPRRGRPTGAGACAQLGGNFFCVSLV